MLHLESDEEYVCSDEQSQQPSGDKRRPAHKYRGGMMLSCGPFLKSGKPEQKNYQQRNSG
jgi:hypothetical protein